MIRFQPERTQVENSIGEMELQPLHMQKRILQLQEKVDAFEKKQAPSATTKQLQKFNRSYRLESNSKSFRQAKKPYNVQISDELDFAEMKNVNIL